MKVLRKTTSFHDKFTSSQHQWHKAEMMISKSFINLDLAVIQIFDALQKNEQKNRKKVENCTARAAPSASVKSLIEKIITRN